MIPNDIKETAELVRFMDVLKSEFPNKEEREYKSLLERAITRIGKQMDVQGEKWKRITSTDYFVSDHGNVRHSNSPQNQSKKGFISNGYHFVYFNKRSHPIHRLVAMAFKPCDNPEQMVVNHKNEIRSDNHVDNLEWMTSSDNIAYSMVKHNRYKSVYAYTAEGELVGQYDGVRGCVEAGFVRESVYNCLRNESVQHRDVYFRMEEVTKQSVVDCHAEKEKRVQEGRTKTSNSQQDLYDTIEEHMIKDVKITMQGLAESLGVTRQTISNNITEDMRDIIKDYNESL